MARLRNTKARLIASTVRLASEGGIGAATVNAIARETGITEGAIYRHYRSKEDLFWDAYKRIIEEMIREKEHLLSSASPFPEILRDWVQLTFAYYDRQPRAFTYVLLMAPPTTKAEDEITTHQGKLFMELLKRASKDVRAICPELALSHFTGVMLNVPRLINEGRLQGPASRYIDEVANAVWNILKAER